MVLMYGTGLPVVKVGRIAGQFAKPRSAPTEMIDGKEYLLGDIFTLSNAVEPPAELWGDDDDAECVEC